MWVKFNGCGPYTTSTTTRKAPILFLQSCLWSLASTVTTRVLSTKRRATHTHTHNCAELAPVAWQWWHERGRGDLGEIAGNRAFCLASGGGGGLLLKLPKSAKFLALLFSKNCAFWRCHTYHCQHVLFAIRKIPPPSSKILWWCRDKHEFGRVWGVVCGWRNASNRVPRIMLTLRRNSWKF